MPPLSAWAVRAALTWLALAALVGALILARDALGLPALATLIPMHAEIMLVGWTMQLAFGVANWILPRQPSPPGPLPLSGEGESRGKHLPVALALVALNLGVVLVIVGAVFAGRVLEVLAVAGFAVQGVPRIRAAGWGATGKEGDLVALKKRQEMI